MEDSGNADEFKKSRNELFKNAMDGNWDKIVDAYKKNPDLHSAKMTKSKNTALHIAVAYGKESAVAALVGEIKAKKKCTIRDMTNERNDTPLHVAAKLGNTSICYLMAEKDLELMEAANCDGETPLFLAALHGKEDAFLCLRGLYTGSEPYKPCRRSSDGDTVLHAAISGEYFSLAYHIIQCYPDLVYYVNQIGWSPFHTLASKPTSFYSGTVLRWTDRVIYSCIIVQEPGMKEQTQDPRKGINNLNDEGSQRQQSNPQPNRDSDVSIEQKNNSNDEESQRQHSNPQRNNRRDQPEREPKGQPAFHHLRQNVSRFFKPLIDALILSLGMFLGISKIQEIIEEKKKHTWANKIVERMCTIEHYQYDDTGMKPDRPSDEGLLSGSKPPSDDDPHHEISQSTGTTIGGDQPTQGGRAPNLNNSTNTYQAAQQESNMPQNDQEKTDTLQKALALISKNVQRVREVLEKKNQPTKPKYLGTPMLIAAKMGVTEIVERTVEKYPVSIDDTDSDGKNVVLVAVEHRQLKVYNLLKKKKFRESMFHHLDKEGNSALHLAAKLGEFRPWFIPGDALKMQWEIKWYEFVKSSMSPHFFARYNNKGKTPQEIFTETHEDLVAKGREWLTKTSESCSVVAALIATVAFATSATIPGSYEAGKPILEDRPAFTVFSISSLVALCSSGTALVLFLAIITSRFQEKDFGDNLPRKLLFGMTSLFTSIASIFVSFCAAHFFILKDRFRHIAFMMYAVTCLPVTIFALEQLGLYFDLLKAICLKEPQFSKY